MSTFKPLGLIFEFLHQFLEFHPLGSVGIRRSHFWLTRAYYGSQKFSLRLKRLTVDSQDTTGTYWSSVDIRRYKYWLKCLTRAPRRVHLVSEDLIGTTGAYWRSQRVQWVSEEDFIAVRNGCSMYHFWLKRHH